jgi:hypothetical protein
MSITRGTVGGGTKSPRRFCKLARIVALATLMLGVGSVPSQATSITHNFDSDTLVHDYNFVPFMVGPDTFYLYTFRVGFLGGVSDSFNLTITDNPIAFEGPNVDSVLGPGFKCVKMTLGDNQCVDFIATSPDPGGLPQSGDEFTGPVTIAIRYALFGWPTTGDPIDIGVTDNFSSFMVYASQTADPGPPAFDDTYRVLHFSTNASSPNPTVEDITYAHCGGSNINACAQANGLDTFVVPEPATIGSVLWGLLGLTVLGRRLKRRD